MSAGTIRKHIDAKHLVAKNTATSAATRPRYSINHDDLMAFIDWMESGGVHPLDAAPPAPKPKPPARKRTRNRTRRKLPSTLKTLAEYRADAKAK